MKSKLIRILFSFSLIAFSLVSVGQSYAQDASPADVYENNDEKDREPIFSEQLDQHHKVQPSTLLKDSAASIQKITAQRPAPAKPATENIKPESKQSSDDSILSFNFLYYIIQKYKLQDIVD